MARELDLDLVEVAPLANPPVCRIMDYGKFKYEEAQRAKESRQEGHQRLGQGDEVPAEDRRGRLRHQDPQGRRVPRRGPQGQGHDHVPWPGGVPPRARRRRSSTRSPSRWRRSARSRRHARLDGRNMTMVLAPDKKAQQAAKHDERAEPADDRAERRAPDAPRPRHRAAGSGRRPSASRRPAAVEHRRRSADRPPADRPPTSRAPTETTRNTMPKMKTTKTAAKRFKKTGTGKLRRQQSMRQHLFEKKPSTRTRRLDGDGRRAPRRREARSSACSASAEPPDRPTRSKGDDRWHG